MNKVGFTNAIAITALALGLMVNVVSDHLSCKNYNLRIKNLEQQIEKLRPTSSDGLPQRRQAYHGSVKF